jgi:hypothetical protein
MGSDEGRTILRIRCSRELFRRFKKLAVDYDNYENALEALIHVYERSIELHPELIMTKKKPGKYVVTEKPF